MDKNAQKIIEEIKNLLDQLASIYEGKPIKKLVKQSKSVNITKGASGALSMLIEEGFFDKPKDISAITGRLQEIGRYYPRTSVAMNLLNFTKRRVFNRLKSKGVKNWQYVLRK